MPPNTTTITPTDNPQNHPTHLTHPTQVQAQFQTPIDPSLSDRPMMRGRKNEVRDQAQEGDDPVDRPVQVQGGQVQNQKDKMGLRGSGTGKKIQGFGMVGGGVGGMELEGGVALGSEFTSTVIPPTPLKPRPSRRHHPSSTLSNTHPTGPTMTGMMGSVEADGMSLDPGRRLSSSSLSRPEVGRRVSGSSVSTSASGMASGEGKKGDERGRSVSGSGSGSSGSVNGMMNGLGPASVSVVGVGKNGGRPYGRSISARELSVGGTGESGLRVRSGSGSAASASGSGSGLGPQARLGESIVRPRSVSGDGSLGQAYVPPLSRGLQVGPGGAGVGGYPYPGVPQGYPTGYAQVTPDGMVVQPLQPQPRNLAAQGYVLYPRGGGSGPSSATSGTAPRSGYWVEQGTGQHYYHPVGQQDENLVAPHPGQPHQVVEYGYPADGVSYAPTAPVYAQPQAVHYYHAPGYPAAPAGQMVDGRGFVVPDRSLSVSRTSSRSTGAVRYRRSEGEGGWTEEGDDAASVQSSNSAAFTARILAGMGGTNPAPGGERERRDSMGDRLTVPKPEKGKKSKNKEKKKRDDEDEEEKKTSSRKPISAASSAATGLTGSALDGDSDDGSRPTTWRSDLRPGDTVTDPNYPTAHGCPYCDKVYTGQHARSICRRHQMSKHGIELEVQVKKSRWDNNPNRPANEAEKHRRTLESKRRWAAKDRRRRRAEKLGLPMPESSDEDGYDMRSESGSVTPSVSETATSRASASRSDSVRAVPPPAPPAKKGGAAKSKLRDVSAPPKPAQRITAKEAARLAAMEKIRSKAGQPGWTGDASSEEDGGEGEDEDDPAIQETEILGASSPFVSKKQTPRSKKLARMPAVADKQKQTTSQSTATDSSNIHPAFLDPVEKREVKDHYESYPTDFPDITQIDGSALIAALDETLPEADVAPTKAATPASKRAKPPTPILKPPTGRTVPTRRSTAQPVQPPANEEDVFGSGPIAQTPVRPITTVKYTNNQEGPITPTASTFKTPSLMPPPAFKTPVAPSGKNKSNGETKKSTAQLGQDNEEAAEILLAISASPAPAMRKPPSAEDLNATKAGHGRQHGMATRLGTNGDVEMDEPDNDPGPNRMQETPSRPSGPRRRAVQDATPLRRLPMRSTRTNMSAARLSDDEFAVPELQSATKDLSSSTSKRHEDSPITPAELQPAADILPYRRGKPPMYRRKNSDQIGIAKPELSSPPNGLPLTKATPTPKTSAMRSGMSSFAGYRSSALATPARPGTMASMAGIQPSPAGADYTSFSSPSGLDLTQKLGLAPAPTVPESPTWLEMVRATPDTRYKRTRPGSMDSDAGGGNENSPRKRVRV